MTTSETELAILDAVTAERKRITALLRDAIPLHRIPGDCTYTPEAIDNLMKLHFEPEHEEGVTCWCNPTMTVNHVDKKTYIDHKEQRIVIRDFLNENFVSKEEKIAALSLGSNQARRAIIKVMESLTRVSPDAGLEWHEGGLELRG